jgi:sulfur transfer protein SufE
MKAVGASGMKGLMEIVMATHSGMTAAEFKKTVSDSIFQSVNESELCVGGESVSRCSESVHESS